MALQGKCLQDAALIGAPDFGESPILSLVEALKMITSRLAR